VRQVPRFSRARENRREQVNTTQFPPPPTAAAFALIARAPGHRPQQRSHRPFPLAVLLDELFLVETPTLGLPWNLFAAHVV
jgi:hypothetical protein